jgi:TolB protein
MGDIFTIGLNDVRPVQLTGDTYNNVEPDYSPDGKMIAYASDVGGDHDLWILDSAGNSHVKITSDLSSERAPAWSPDGNKIAYVSNREGEFNIWVMNLETEEINFEIVDNPAEDNENVINNEYVKKLRDYAASNPKEFISIVLLASFGFVVLIVGSFLRKIS